MLADFSTPAQIFDAYVSDARSAGVLVHESLVYQHIPGVLLVPEDLLDGKYRPRVPA